MADSAQSKCEEILVTNLSYWRTVDTLKKATPQGLPNPEGFDVVEYLRNLWDGEFVIDFGCGYGRLSQAFDPGCYLGIDVNVQALELARERNPGYNYQVGTSLPQQEGLVLFYTVLLHMSDEEITALNVSSDRIIVAEILAITLPTQGLVYDRSVERYERLFSNYELFGQHEMLYKHYDKDMTFLDFQRREE